MIVAGYQPLQLNALAVEGRPGPERALVLKGQLRWCGPAPVFLVGVEGTLLFHDRVLTEIVRPRRINLPGGNNAYIESKAERYAEFVAPLSAEAIRFIEVQRQAANLHLKLELRYQWLEVGLRAGEEQDEANDRPSVLYGERVLWGESEINVPIARSDWISNLRQMEWSEIELFEVPALPLREDPNLTEALRLLGDAQADLRAGSYKGVLAKCREALESAAQYESQGDTKKGFELLLARAFPEHEAKPRTLDPLIHALSGFAHLGRHAKYPALHIAREEAEFAYTTTLGLFSLISRRLAG